MRGFSVRFCLLILAIYCSGLVGSLSTRAETLPPTKGTPINGATFDNTPNGSLSLAVFENSLLFGNAGMQAALTNNALTRDFLTDSTTNQANPLYSLWFDPSSVLLMSEIWSIMHQPPDPNLAPDFLNDPNVLDITSPANGERIIFYGRLGLCESSLAANLPLSQDDACQHWLSALLLGETNSIGVRSLFSAMGPSSDSGPGLIGTQLTAAAGAVRGYQYYFGTETPVHSITDACAPGTSGPTDCGWTTAFVGVCTPFDTFQVQTHNATAPAIPMMVMVNQGIHANDYPFNFGGMGASDGNFLGAATAGTPSPVVFSQCPPSGTFNVQWAPYNRDDIPSVGSNMVTFSAISTTNSPIIYPANELDIFRRSNREGYFAGNIFTKSNIAPWVRSCEVRPVSSCNGPLLCPTQRCDPSVTNSCIPCGGSDYRVDFATLPNNTQVAASDVTTTTFSPTSIVSDQFAGAGVHFNGTGLMTEIAGVPTDGFSTRSDDWCPNGGYSCGNNVVLANANASGNVFDTLKITFDLPQTTVKMDIDDGYLGDATSSNVVLKSGGNSVATLTLKQADEVAACPSSQSPFQLCGRFYIGAPNAAAFDEIDVLPTTLFGHPTCTVPSGNASDNPDCGGSLIDNLAFSSSINQPGSQSVAFPNAHNWFEPNFGTDAYAAARSCSNGASSCMANYEGSISTGPAACGNLSLDVDTANPRSYAGTARPLYDVGMCSLDNFQGKTPAAFEFDDPVNGSYPAYGVTSFFANYGTGIDGIGVTCSPLNQAPTSTASACGGGSCGSSITVSEGASVTLDGTGSTDPDGDPLAYAWSESVNAVAPSVSSNPQYTFAVPVGSAGGTLNFSLTASDPCYRVARSGVTVKVKSNTSTTLTSSVNPSVVGQPVTFTATVLCAGSCSGAPTPTGTVAFTQTSGPPVLLSSSSGTLDSSTGKATVTASGTLATFNIAAFYHGDGNFNVSTGTLSQVVGLAPTTTTVTFSPTPNAILGQSVTITATVTSGFGIPNGGGVVFFDGSTQLGPPVTLSFIGIATLTTSNLAIGAHAIKAIYIGNSTFAPSSGTNTLNVIYKVVAQYNQTTPSKSGTTVPIKVQLQNFAGKNLSSSSITLTLTTNPVSPSPAPGAQPSGTFAFVSKSDTGPGYQYNLKTTNFPKNTYSLSFTATGDPVVHKVGFVIN